MASAKRGAAFNHYGRDQPNKRHQPGHGGQNRPQQHHGIATTQSSQPALSARDLETGLVALLDRYVAEETTPGADQATLHHAHELRRLLCARNDSVSSGNKRELDQKRPDMAAHVRIPDYVERKVRASKHLPPLPPIAEPHLHQAVFTHRSAHCNPGIPGSLPSADLSLDYERLELLGDAYLELIASRALYNRFPHVDVPELCVWRERLVENATLGKFSEAYGFPDRLKHRGVWDKGSKQWHKVIADMVEAYIAALVLSDPENGFATAEDWLTELWAPQLLGFREKIIENPQAREELNRLVLGKGVKLVTREARPMKHEHGVQHYYMDIRLTGWGYEDEWLGNGEGQNKVQAGVAAAADALKRNSAVLQDAMRQKAELKAVQAKEKEEKAKAREGLKDVDVPEVEGSVQNKRGSEADANAPEKTKKKHKKEREEKKEKKEKKETKKRKASSDSDSS